MKRATGAEILATWKLAYRDKRTNVHSRRVLAAVQRTGQIGDLRKLALACQISRDRLERSLDDLREAGYLAGYTVQDVSTRRIRSDVLTAA